MKGSLARPDAARSMLSCWCTDTGVSRCNGGQQFSNPRSDKHLRIATASEVANNMSSGENLGTSAQRIMDPSASMPKPILPPITGHIYHSFYVMCIIYTIAADPHIPAEFESWLPAGTYRTNTGKTAPEGPGDRRLGPLRCATLGRHETPTTEQLQPGTGSQATEPEGDYPRSSAGETY